MKWQGRPTAYERILKDGGVAEHSHFCRHCKRFLVCRTESCGEMLTDRRDKDGRTEGPARPLCSSCTGATVTNAVNGRMTISMTGTSATTTTYTFPSAASGTGWHWGGIPLSNGSRGR